MDDPKKSSNEPASSGSEEKNNEIPPEERISPDDSISETSKTGTGEGDDAATVEESPEAPASTGDEDDDKTDTAPSVENESGEIIEDNGEAYEDPYDPDGIYGEYNEYYEEEGYPESPAQPMPERPDDPYQEEEEDRAIADEALAADKVLTDEKLPEHPKEDKSSTPDDAADDPEDEDEDEGFFEERDKELGGRMSFLDHLDELRKRIFHAMISIIVTFVVAWIFREYIFGFLSAPIKDVVDQLVVLKPTEPFTVYLKVSFAAAIFFAIPYIMFQVWLFIAPGLYRKEKIYALPFLFSSSILFVLGGAFAYYIILPPALNFLLNEFGSEFKAVISAVEYYDFELIIIVGMGAVFQLPVIVAFLSMFGMVSPGFLWRNFKYAFLLITILAAVVSPTTDPMNLFLWSGPMTILYTFSIGVSWIFQLRRNRKKQKEDEKYD